MNKRSSIAVLLTSPSFYFYLPDFAGHTMDLSEVLLTSTNFTTACCRALAFSPGPPSIVEYTVNTNTAPVLYSFSLSSPVTQDCLVTLNTSTANVTFIPGPEFYFKNYSTELSRTFQVRALTTGEMNITVSAYLCGDYITPDVLGLVVRGLNSPPPAPKLKTVLFSDNGKTFMCFRNL
jgi:hypothetical protein